jgi:hypothetical protein
MDIYHKVEKKPKHTDLGSKIKEKEGPYIRRWLSFNLSLFFKTKMTY